MKISLVSLVAGCLLAVGIAGEILIFEYPFDRHIPVELKLNGCNGAEGILCEMRGLPLDVKVEFRAGKISSELPAKLNMELMTKESYNAGISTRLYKSIKKAINGEEVPETASTDEALQSGRHLFTDVEKVIFTPLEETMYVKLTGEFDGVARPDKPLDACEPLRLVLVLERLYFGVIPQSMAIVLIAFVVIFVFFWLIGMPLVEKLLAPSVVEATTDKKKDGKKSPAPSNRLKSD